MPCSYIPAMDDVISGEVGGGVGGGRGKGEVECVCDGWQRQEQRWR